MDVSKSDDSHGERAFPSTGSKKEAVIELLVDCCLVTAGDGIEGRAREGTPAAASAHSNSFFRGKCQA